MYVNHNGDLKRELKQQQQNLAQETNAPLFRPNQLDLLVKNYSQNSINQVLIKVQSPSNHEPSPSVLVKPPHQINIAESKFNNFDFAPHITIQCENDDARSLSNYESDFNRMENSRSPSFLGYLTSTSSVAITPSSTNNEIEAIVSNSKYGSTKKQNRGLPPLLLPPPLHVTQRNKISFNSSSSSNNLSSHKLSVNEFSFGSSLGKNHRLLIQFINSYYK